MAGTGPRFKLELGGFQPVAPVKDLTDGLWRGLVLLLLSYIDRTEGLWLCREHGTGTDWWNHAVWPRYRPNLYGLAIWTDWVHSQSFKVRWCFKSKLNPPLTPSFCRTLKRETDSTILLFKFVSPSGIRFLSNKAKTNYHMSCYFISAFLVLKGFQTEKNLFSSST